MGVLAAAFLRLGLPSMPVTTVHNLQLLFHDFKHSNYFRVWFLTFVACFIIFWVGNVLLRLS